MRYHGVNFWKQVPFLRLLIPLVGGILLGYYSFADTAIAIVAGSSALFLFLLSRFLSNTLKYSHRWVLGSLVCIIWIAAGFIACRLADPRIRQSWVGRHDLNGATIAITIAEPLLEKERSFKTTGIVYARRNGNQWKSCTGKILIYLDKKDLPEIRYGDRLLFRATVRQINNSGNPGGFDYRGYCAFQGIYHQVFLKKENYLFTRVEKRSFNRKLFEARDWILSVLKKYVPGDKETGVAEALLLGYRNDLDRDLVQAYSKTGVVHIIAISGLHLGMIYGLLVGIFSALPRNRLFRLLKPVIILVVLWGFSLLTGAAASILRSAVMFSFIVIGQGLDRRSNICNTLAASACCLLLYNPFFLWDVGFLLSYTAVLSIVLFSRPVYKKIYFKNRILATTWQLNSVTISAQALTLPLILFCFHQFPNLFLFTNGVAVPLSGLILYAAILLPFFSFFTPLASFCGNMIGFLTRQMDNYIERTASLPFAVTDNINISLFQTVVLYFLIIAAVWWLSSRKSTGLLIALLLLVIFIIPSSIRTIHTKQQHKLIVYQVPGQTAIDIMEGTGYRFIGNDTVTRGPLAGFVLAPARLRYGACRVGSLTRTRVSGAVVAGRHKRALILNRWNPAIKSVRKPTVDIIVLCAGAATSPALLSRYITCSQYVFDGSAPLWKIRQWKKEAESLHLRHHSTPEQGAFVVDL